MHRIFIFSQLNIQIKKCLYKTAEQKQPHKEIFTWYQTQNIHFCPIHEVPCQESKQLSEDKNLLCHEKPGQDKADSVRTKIKQECVLNVVSCGSVCLFLFLSLPPLYLSISLSLTHTHTHIHSSSTT